MTKNPNKGQTIHHFVGRTVFYLFIAWILGLVLFYRSLPDPSPISAFEPTDGVVVLTGGSGRIEAGLKLLEHGRAKRLLISGVNPIVGPDDLTRISPEAKTLYSCCIDLGREARDTPGNAVETSEWVKSKNYKSLTFVTNTYHVPRSHILLRQEMPEITLKPHPVNTSPKLSTYIIEYNKYLFTLAKVTLM